MKRWLALLPLAVLAALTIVFGVWSLRQDPQYRPDALVGQPLPSRTLPVLVDAAPSATTLDLASLAAGQPVIVNLFASWCAPCRLEHPQLMALKARGYRIVGIAYKDDPAATSAFLTELGNPFEVVLIDGEGRAGLDLGLSGVPETFAVGPDGRIRAKVSGPLTSQADLDHLTNSLKTP